MLDDERQFEAEMDMLIAAIGASLRQAVEEVEVIRCSSCTPLVKMDQVGAVLENLGDSLERCVDRFPR